MRLLHLHVENFGTLQSFSLSPAEGFNVLYQKNGWGKTTLAVFIKAMLYGLPSTTRQTLDENERKKYAPWQGGAFGGSIEFETEKGRFRAERFFGAKESQDTFALFDLDSNLPSSVYSASLGEELFGIDADGFERSTYFSQRTLKGSRDNNSISAKLGDLLDDVDDVSNFDTAMASLEKRRRFYVMTGGRGAVSETEASLIKLQGELEQCCRVEEALHLREEELAELEKQQRLAKDRCEEMRRDLQKAGLARERAALLAQKETMQGELTVLLKRRERINDFFRNAPPTEAELDEGRRAYEAIKDAKARLDAIPSHIPEIAALERLRHRYPKGAPDEHTWERMESDNRELVGLCSRYTAMNEEQDHETILSRFPNGVPEDEALNHATDALGEAERVQGKLASASARYRESSRSKARGFLFASAIVLGLVLSILGYLPILSSAQVVLLICGSTLVLSASVGWLIWARKRKQAEQRSREAIEQYTKQKMALLASVYKLLAAYEIQPSSDADLLRCITELSGLCERYRDALRRKKAKQSEAEHLIERIRRLSSRLHSVFVNFYESLPHKNDYRAELETMHRELDLLTHLESAAKRLDTERTSAYASLQAKKQALLPFLQRFDPAGNMRAGECLEQVGAQLVEYNRLGREIADKQKKLELFVSEKKLDTRAETIDTAAYDRIAAEERKIAEHVTDLEQRRNRLLSEVERLSEQTERIPELSQKMDQLKATLDEYRANYATIQNTSKLLSEAKTALSTRYLGGMQKSFSDFLGKLLQKAAPEAIMDTSFEVRLRQGGQTRKMESFSRGWRDAVELCTRLSLTDALFRDSEKPFLLLDDPFVNLDDERLPAARALLEELSADYQILYFVCHKDRI